ncbi:MAG: DMT family transporter [Acidobacteria bacterium]|nr:DMT family transporter [Acidobacteriota bacterium]
MRSRCGAQADLVLALVAFIWGLSFVVVKLALEEFPPLLFLSLRLTLASAILALYFRRRWRELDGHSLKYGSLIGLFLFLGFALQTLGLKGTTPSKSAFITSFSILLVPLLGWFLFRLLPSVQTALGVSLALVGMFLLTYPTGQGSFNRGDVLTLGCAGAFALHILAIGHFTRKASFAHLAVVQIASAAVFSWAVWPFSGGFPAEPTVRGWASLLFAGILATALAFFLQNWAQQFVSATRTGLMLSLEPIFAALVSFAWYGERLPPRGFLGGALIVAGILLSEWRR